MKKLTVILLVLVLILSMTACVVKQAEAPLTTPAATEPMVTTPALENPAADPAPEGEETTPAATEPAAEFTFVVMDKEGKEETFIITTAREFVGEALMDEGLIAGEEGPYGLYVLTVNGITLDYATDGMYWAFYINGEYGLTGVDQTPINPAEIYMFKAEAG